MKITNLVQIMELMGIKFLGTVKDCKSFLFQIINVNDSGDTVLNGCPVIQGYGTRTSFKSRSGSKIASVMRHGTGKVCMARAATNIVECHQDTWAYEANGVLTYKKSCL